LTLSGDPVRWSPGLYLLLPVAAMEAHVVEAGIVQAVLVLLHLGLDAADPPVAALLAPAAVLPPRRAGALQRRVAAAAELDVVDGRVVAKQTPVGLHAHLEGGEHAAGAVLGLGPVTEAAPGGKMKSGRDQMEINFPSDHDATSCFRSTHGGKYIFYVYTTVQKFGVT